MNLSNQAQLRLTALKATKLLDSAPEEVFDRLTTLAAQALGVPVTLISLVDDDRQFFKSAVGLPAPVCDTRETPLSYSFCQHVVAVGEPLVINDARDHTLLRSNLAVRDLGVVAYAGVPLTDKEGNCFGSLCAIDTNPREWKPAEVELLKALAVQTMSELEIRARVRNLAKDLSEMQLRENERRETNRLTVHDLRTPLNSLVMSLDLLSTLGLNAEQAEWAEVARTSTGALKELVDDLIDNEAISQKGQAALNLGDVNPLRLAGAVLDQVKGSLHAKVMTLNREFAPGLPNIRVDEQKIIRVLVNLLGNAIKFTPEKGTITFSVSQRSPEVLAFSISDTGIGFDQTQADIIFDKGVMLDGTARSRISTGWGLEFCRRAVDAHGGRIEVMSAIQRGSTFTVLLPIRSQG